MEKKYCLLFAFCFLLFHYHFAQPISTSHVSADVQSDFQYNDEVSHDSAFGLNIYMNAAYRWHGFEAGMRYEAFQKPLLGFQKNMEDQGVPHRYVSFQHKGLKATAGSYYVQFGYGLVLRSYEARGLGLDNALDGIKLDYNIKNKIFLTALSGRQRYFFEPRDKYKSLIRGVDGNIFASDFFSADSKLKVQMGGSYASRYNPQWAANIPFDSLPALVEASSGRIHIAYQEIFSIGGEYAYKSKDPTDKNFKKDTIGKAIYLTSSFALPGFGLNVSYKEITDFDFRSDPLTSDNEHALNFLPPFTRQPVYKLFSKFPYQTQNRGERGFQGEINYSPKRGMDFLLNHSEMYGLKGERYYDETTFEGEIKVNSKNRLLIAYSYLDIDTKTILLMKADRITAHIVSLENVFRINRKHSVRPNIQFLYSKQDTAGGKDNKGNWVYAQLEYTISPQWGFSVYDEYNTDTDKEHLFTVFLKYIDGNNQFTLSYGKQSDGITCVGGVCRYVPAFSGVAFSVISKF